MSLGSHPAAALQGISGTTAAAGRSRRGGQSHPDLEDSAGKTHRQKPGEEHREAAAAVAALHHPTGSRELYGSPVLGSVGVSPPSESSWSSVLGSSPCSIRDRRSGLEMAVSACKKGIRTFPSPGGTETPQPLPTNLPSLLGRTGNGSRGLGRCSPTPAPLTLSGPWGHERTAGAHSAQVRSTSQPAA